MDNNSRNLTPFALDVLKGLNSPLKYIPPKYHYDYIGSKIYKKLLDSPEYYPSLCEMEILTKQSNSIFNCLNFQSKFNIVDLGSGDGVKTIEFLKIIEGIGIRDYVYIPIDISQELIKELVIKIKESLPNIQIKEYVGDYFNILKYLKLEDIPTLFLSFGTSIGNFDEFGLFEYFNEISNIMKSGDKFLIGFDLKKSPIIINNTYNDKLGIIKEYNMNILNRLNIELNMNINMDYWDFYSFYNPENGEVREYIFSKIKQNIKSKLLNVEFEFYEGETIWTEISKKYTIKDIQLLATKFNFKIIQNFIDSKNYFSDSLWEKL